MLYFKYSDNRGNWHHSPGGWHIGEGLPTAQLESARVVTFQADGDELQIILDALKRSSKKGQS